MEITPRRTRLIRAADLRAFRHVIARLACDGEPLDARDRLIIVPTRASAAHLVRSIEATSADGGRAVLLPDLITPRDLVARFAARLPFDRVPLTDAEREVLLGAACRAAQKAGVEPPFRLRPALVAEMLRFYDTLRWNVRDVDTFERLALGRLEPGAGIDRGAERLVRQTRFLAAAFRAFEDRCAAQGPDEHGLRARVLAEPASRPILHVVVAAGDRAFDRYGLHAADWDLLARAPGVRRLDVVVTDTTLAGAPHERMHTLLPGIEEVRVPPDGSPSPLLVTASDGAYAHVSRDREEEVAGFARRVKGAARRGDLELDRAALVVHGPLPYVYLTREVCRSAGIPCQMVDALPLAAEPYAAALDLVCAAVASSFARGSGIALLRCPQFDFLSAGPPISRDAEMAAGDDAGDAAGDASLEDVMALDRALGESGYLGGLASLEHLLERWRAGPAAGAIAGARRAGAVLRSAARELEPLGSPAAAADHLSTLTGFLTGHARTSDPIDPLHERERRARGAVLALLRTLRGAYARFDPSPVGFEVVTSLVRRWIEGHTFAPRSGEGGVHVVDADSARFADFDLVQLAGLVDGEWPDRPRRNIFYAPEILRELGWPAESDRREAARARFIELLRLPAARVAVSTFLLDADAAVSPSSLLDELDAAGLDVHQDEAPASRIFEHEALGLDPVVADHLEPFTRRWAQVRDARVETDAARYRGFTAPHVADAWSLSALERYQGCPFKFFAADVLRLEEAPDDGSTFSPRARGRFVHEVLHRFFEAWDARGGGAITPARLDQARATFAEAAEPLLARLPQPDASLERARLFGTAVSMGAMDVLLGVEVARPEVVRERWLEYRLEGAFSLGEGDEPVRLRGVADRIDLLPGRRLRVVDYKTGVPPHPKTALQVPLYALCASERLERRDGAPWAVDEAAYVRLAGARPLVPVIPHGGQGAGDTLEAARGRLHRVLRGIGRGEFPPRPSDPGLCARCAFSTVCRKEYVER